MKKFFCMTGMVAILAAVCIFGVGCGKRKDPFSLRQHVYLYGQDAAAGMG